MKAILIDADTLRADHLGCYGYRYPTSPHMDRLAHEGTLFESFFAPCIPTQPAHTTIYSGQHAITHGIVAHGSETSQPPAETPWLPAVLQEAGIVTGAVDNLSEHKPWFARGYTEYIFPKAFSQMVKAAEINEHASDWLRHHAQDDFFLFLHYWDLHTPYMPPKPYREIFYTGNRNDPTNRSLDAWRRQRAFPFFEKWHLSQYGEFTDLDYVRALYDGEIGYLDEHVGRLLDLLDELGIAEETLVILCTDHGETMYEHVGFFDHAGLYETTVHIPLILRGPGVAPGQRITAMAQHLDLAPTILDYFGLPAPAAMEGCSLRHALTGEPWTGYDRIYLTECTWQAKWALRTAEWKLIQVVDPGVHGIGYDELYHLSEDPGEQMNLAASRPDVKHTLTTELDIWRAQRLAGRPDPVRVAAKQGVPAKEWMRKSLGLGDLTWDDWVRQQKYI